MNIAKLGCGGLLAFILAAACGGKSTQAGGSNTNWFATCSSTAECGSGLECWCGLCTSTCATECAKGPAGATCEMPPASCTDPPKEAACVVGCTKDADCKNLGEGATCAGAVCRKGGGAKLSCDQRSTEAYDRIQALLGTADQTCASTADCMEFPTVSCRNSCSVGTVSTAGARALAGDLAAIEDEVCKPFTAAGCKVTEPPCVFPGVPTCVAGKCEHQLPGMNPTSCDDRATQIGDRLYTALGAADKSCSVDADCTRIGPGDKCFTGCPTYPVSTQAASDFVATRAAVDRDLCDAYLADGCAPQTFFGCPAIPAQPPKCIGGTCVDVFSSTTGDAGAGTSCNVLSAQIQSHALDAADAVDHACTTAADCKLTTLINKCLFSCMPAATSKSGALSLEETLSAMEAEYCGQFAAAGCTTGPLPCPGPWTATCQNGQCAVGRP